MISSVDMKFSSKLNGLHGRRLAEILYVEIPSPKSQISNLKSPAKALNYITQIEV